MSRIPLFFAFATAALTIGAAWATAPWAKEAPGRGTKFVPGQRPLACRFSCQGEAGQREGLDEWAGLGLRSDSLLNPVLADLIRVEVRNTSDQDVTVYECGSGAERPFRVDVEIRDVRGRLARWPNRGPAGGIKRLSPMPGFTRVVTIKPGESIVQRDRIWRSLVAANLPTPGEYDVRVICTYDAVPEGEERRFESAALRITVTEDDIREWLLYRVAVEHPPGQEIEVPGR